MWRQAPAVGLGWGGSTPESALGARSSETTMADMEQIKAAGLLSFWETLKSQGVPEPEIQRQIDGYIELAEWAADFKPRLA